MVAITSQSQHQYPSHSPASPQVVVITRRKYTPTTLVERLLLLLNILLLPLEVYGPTIGGFSSMFFLFAISGLYVLLWRVGSLAQIWNHRVLLACYFLIFVGFILETCSLSTNYAVISRIAQMCIGVMVIATLCRDIRALRSCILGYMLAGIWVSLYLFLTFYGTLQGASASNFDEATRVRLEMIQQNSIEENMNTLAFFVGQGAVAAMAMAFMCRSVCVRYSLFGITALCLVASFLPLSRGGIVLTLIACIAVVMAYVGANRGTSVQRVIRILALMLGLGMCMLLWVPQAGLARLTLTPKTASGVTNTREARIKTYTAALTHLPEYWLVGVGAGNFWGPWGRRSQFVMRYGLIGAHNSYIQVTIYWGLLGLLALIGIVYFAYRCLPKKCGNNPYSLAVLGVVVALAILMLQDHSLYFKGYALGLGILIGMQYWIWPASETQLSERIAWKTLAERGTAA